MSWAKWDAEHPNHHKEGEGGERSADKLAAMIKATVGNHEGVRAEVRPHGSGGSVVHKTTKGDLKRPVQPKGHKDRGDSARTTIRMAAHYRGKRGEEVGPTGEIKPESGNTGKLRSADRLVAARDERPSDERARAHYQMVADRAKKATDTARTSKDYDEAAQLHRRAAELAPTENHRNVHERLADTHERLAENERKGEALAAERRKTEEAARAAASKKADDERKAAQARLTERRTADAAQDDLSDRAHDASVEAEKHPTKEAHQKASDLHQQAADNARKAGLTAVANHHQNLSAQHQMVADARGRGPSGKIGSMGSYTGGGGAAAKPAKTAALTTQNLHKAMAEAGLERTPKVAPSYDHMGRVLHRPTGRTAGRYDVRKEYDGSHTVDISVGGSSYGVSDSDRVEKATQAMQARGWKVEQDSGMYGRLRVSKPEEAPARSADKLVGARDVRARSTEQEKGPSGKA